MCFTELSDTSPYLLALLLYCIFLMMTEEQLNVYNKYYITNDTLFVSSEISCAIDSITLDDKDKIMLCHCCE